MDKHTNLCLSPLFLLEVFLPLSLPGFPLLTLSRPGNNVLFSSPFSDTDCFLTLPLLSFLSLFWLLMKYFPFTFLHISSFLPPSSPFYTLPLLSPLSILQYPVLEQTQGNQMCGESGQMGGVERSDRQGKKVIEYKQQRWKKINSLCSYACWRCDNKLCTLDDILRGIFCTHIFALLTDNAGFKISRAW